ncbi:MAG: pyridoxamine 5'-phosphate oxidase family protein [Muribaculaceae bacterium]|nr:pyridoxamine 5'-phosphate oxidase family protein [Muribaculaceae bacterium]
MERKMRRFRQQLPDSESERILREGRYAVMAVAGDDDYPYAVPVNYVLSGRSVYLHSASQGHKIDSLLRHPKCSMCVVDKDDVIPEEFTSYFRSVIVFGQAHIVESADERLEALRLLCGKYSPGIDPEGEIGKFLKTVCVVRIDIDLMTGKEAIELTRRRAGGASL